jgi:hypothetical protein
MIERKVKNYTTSIPAAKSISEIEDMLLQVGAVNFMKRADPVTRQYIEVAFQIEVSGIAVSYRLPARMDSISQMLASQYNREHSRKAKDAEEFEKQAYDTAWRILRDWVDAQIEIIRIGMVQAEEVFLPYMLMDRNTTVYDRFINDGGMRQLLGKGDGQ